jgi:hypothetical protein
MLAVGEGDDDDEDDDLENQPEIELDAFGGFCAGGAGEDEVIVVAAMEDAD